MGDLEAFASLLDQGIKREVAKRAFNIDPGTDELKKVAIEMEEDPRTADTLTRVRTLFEGNETEFLEEYILPRVVESQLWERYAADPGLHRQSYEAAERSLAIAQEDATQFTFLVSAEQGALNQFQIAVTEGSPDPADQSNSLSRIDLPLDRKLLATLKPGEIYPAVVETAEAFRLVKFKELNNNTATVEIWRIPKRNYFEWLAEQARSLDHAIVDPAMNESWASIDPSHWLREALQ